MNHIGLALLLVAAIPLHAADDLPLAHQAVKDAEDLATAPLRWHRAEWLRFAEGSAIVLAAYTVDDQLVRAASRQQNHVLNNYLHRVTPLGGGYGFDLAALLAVGGYLKDDDRMMDAGIDAVESSLAASGVVTPVLKTVVGRARPNKDLGKHSFHPFNTSDQSFPSGHATSAFAIASAIATRYDDSRFVPALAYSLATSVAIARVHSRVHFASDVLAGGLIGHAIAKSIVWNHRRAHVAFVPTLQGMSVRAEF
jgi:membrane-associated phospholipid phosphatase